MKTLEEHACPKFRLRVQENSQQNDMRSCIQNYILKFNKFTFPHSVRTCVNFPFCGGKRYAVVIRCRQFVWQLETRHERTDLLTCVSNAFNDNCSTQRTSTRRSFTFSCAPAWKLSDVHNFRTYIHFIFMGTEEYGSYVWDIVCMHGLHVARITSDDTSTSLRRCAITSWHRCDVVERLWASLLLGCYLAQPIHKKLWQLICGRT